MENHDWTKEVRIDITVCDKRGKILQMNRHAAETFAKYGGENLLGTDLLDCHPEPAKTKLKNMLAEGDENVYTIEKEGKKSLIVQLPWYQNDRFAGLVELNIPLPAFLPHFNRD